MYNKTVMASGAVTHIFEGTGENQEKPQPRGGPAEILRGYFLSTSCEHHPLAAKPLPPYVGRVDEA
jgi:hypothetical protein